MSSSSWISWSKTDNREEIIKLGEDLFFTVISRIKQDALADLKTIKRELPSFEPPFKRITYEQAVKTYGQNFELKLSEELSEPAWLVDFPLEEEREFYDRQDETRPGTLVDMDLIYPGGFGEALSGGERNMSWKK